MVAGNVGPLAATGRSWKLYFLCYCGGSAPDDRSSSSAEEPVADDAGQGGEGVLEADLLALLVGAAGVADRHLVDAPGRPPPGHLGRHLRLEPEPVGAEPEPLEDLAAEELVAGIHVGQVQVGEHV